MKKVSYASVNIPRIIKVNAKKMINSHNNSSISKAVKQGAVASDVKLNSSLRGTRIDTAPEDQGFFYLRDANNNIIRVVNVLFPR